MIPEYSSESFQCGRRFVDYRAVSGNLVAVGQEGRCGNKEQGDLALHCQRRADVPPPGSAGSVCQGPFSN